MSEPVPAAPHLHPSRRRREDRLRSPALLPRRGPGGRAPRHSAGFKVCIIGPDGVGKSSLLALVACARAIQSGRLEVLGGDMGSARHATASPADRLHAPRPGQNLYPTLTCTRTWTSSRALRMDGASAKGASRSSAGHGASPPSPTAPRQAVGARSRSRACAGASHPRTRPADPGRATTGVDPLSRRRSGTPRAHARRPAGMSVSSPRPTWRRRRDSTGGRHERRSRACRLSPAGLSGATGSASLEEAFHRPAAARNAKATGRWSYRRGRGQGLRGRRSRPRPHDALGDFNGRGHRELRIGAGNLRLPRHQRQRQDHDAEEAHGASAC